jgi:hypothetical protein
MKKTLLILSILIAGCVEQNDHKFDRFMSELKGPVVLIGKTSDAVSYPTIVVRDGHGLVRTFTDVNGLPQAISQSRMIGDTLKP